jgi:radical SAM protein with 4Fe4S-binding SPASM domain
MALNRNNTRKHKHQLALDRSLENIGIELTTHCNLSCKMCSEWKRREQEIPTGKILSLLDHARTLGAKKFGTFGTEPFMRKDTADILTYAEQIGYEEICSVSNGLLLNNWQILDKLEKLRTLIMVISLDGPKEIHDELRGKGVFDRAVKTLWELRKRGITTSITSVIMRQTLDYLTGVIDLAAELDVPVVSMQPYERETSGLEKNHEVFEFRPDEERAVKKKLKLLMRYAARRKVVVYTASMMKYVPPYLARRIRYVPPNGCHVPSKVLKVESSGNCYPCVMIRNRLKEKSIGNVYEQSLEKLWHNQAHRELNLLALNRKCPACLAGCSDMESYDAMENNIWPLQLVARVINRVHRS